MPPSSTTAEPPARPRLAAPGEPAELRDRTRLLIERDPRAAAALIARGEWIAAALWHDWGVALRAAGMTRAQLAEIAGGYRQELWLWVMGERPWRHCADGLAGRLERRLDAPRSG